MNRGTFEGNEEEIKLVIDFNKNKYDDKYKILRNAFDHYTYKNVYMVRVTTKQYSKLSDSIVMTRADAYLIKSDFNIIENVLKDNDYYLDEDLLSNYIIPYEKIKYSGISVKLHDSSKYQILKLTPNSFNKIFGEYELGAGASIYCKNEIELIKNITVLAGWHTNLDNVIEKFKSNLPNIELLRNDNLKTETQLEIYKELKNFSNKQIKLNIDSNIAIQEKIFNGYTLYEEPYTATYLYKNNFLAELKYIPFSITTGSGRSKGQYTIVLKPKEEVIHN